ncbi:hypothetical protein SAMN02745245_01192 [Anaerosphaera aminiphila DSM 21120]|uniref:Uncharacterized protein n=1 Tax=Anaerosphaera aminiphila DSM 21120 TaxID=1120995 RepID=A0A1M5SGL8_9FIRM|nr:hypothetical protein [Anaerosphaera aminiphila]SHH37737.1 hypothetical protein SAMN02745245_01192 [Anaerosphaera aminiphila DSM 21120]
MSIKNLVKTILDIEVSTEDILKLHENPQKYTNSEEDAEKLKELFLLMDLADRQEVDEDGNY